MDPQATYRAIIDHLLDGDYDNATGLARELMLWLARGGFAPTDTNYIDILAALSTLERVTNKYRR